MDWVRYGPVIVAILVLWVVATRILRRTPADKPAPQRKEEEGASPRRTSRFSADYDNLEVRLHDYAREIEARIDNRMMVLSQLTADADQAIRELKPLLEELRTEVAKRPSEKEESSGHGQA